MLDSVWKVFLSLAGARSRILCLTTLVRHYDSRETVGLSREGCRIARQQEWHACGVPRAINSVPWTTGFLSLTPPVPFPASNASLHSDFVLGYKSLRATMNLKVDVFTTCTTHIQSPKNNTKTFGSCKVFFTRGRYQNSTVYAVLFFSTGNCTYEQFIANEH